MKPDEHATRWFKPLWGTKQKSDQMSDTKKNFVLTLHDECMTKLLRSKWHLPYLVHVRVWGGEQQLDGLQRNWLIVEHGRFKDVRPDYELSYSVLNPNTWREARELFAKGSLTWKEGTETLKRTAHEEPIFWLCVSCDNDASNEPVRAAEHPDKDSENFFTDPVYIHERCLFGTANAEESAFFRVGLPAETHPGRCRHRSQVRVTMTRRPANEQRWRKIGGKGVPYQLRQKFSRLERHDDP